MNIGLANINVKFAGHGISVFTAEISSTVKSAKENIYAPITNKKHNVKSVAGRKSVVIIDFEVIVVIVKDRKFVTIIAIDENASIVIQLEH